MTAFRNLRTDDGPLIGSAYYFHQSGDGWKIDGANPKSIENFVQNSHTTILSHSYKKNKHWKGSRMRVTGTTANKLNNFRGIPPTKIEYSNVPILRIVSI